MTQCPRNFRSTVGVFNCNISGISSALNFTQERSVLEVILKCVWGVGGGGGTHLETRLGTDPTQTPISSTKRYFIKQGQETRWLNRIDKKTVANSFVGVMFKRKEGEASSWVDKF